MIIRGLDGELEMGRDGAGNRLGYGTCDDTLGGCGAGAAWLRATWSKHLGRYVVFCGPCRREGMHRGL